jgi:hypothetical protein
MATGVGGAIEPEMIQELKAMQQHFRTKLKEEPKKDFGRGQEISAKT